MYRCVTRANFKRKIRCELSRYAVIYQFSKPLRILFALNISQNVFRNIQQFHSSSSSDYIPRVFVTITNDFSVFGLKSVTRIFFFF